jgi:chromosome segregation protein
MRLKHLTLQGYKSFATKTEFLFSDGITAIVGPNGSGKSNIADAIRWSLGEQSMRSLRGKVSADMIFAGGQRRARAGMAEASLTLDNSDGSLPIEYSEVTITRRAYRSGENEYLINRSRVRLRDINEMLAESGLSQRAYAVIGQGLVDAALSLRSDERRELFEEAAGITLYRDRREETVERLEETQHNLERVYDIIHEITPRLERLQREAIRVQEHRRIAAHLERLQRTWYGYQWGRKQEALDYALKRSRATEATLSKQQRKVRALNQQLAQTRKQESTLRVQLRDWHQRSAELHGRTDELQRELAVAEERCRLLKARREELLTELEPLKEQREAQKEQITGTEREIERLTDALTEQRAQLEALQQEWQEVRGRTAAPEEERAALEKKLRQERTRLEQLNQRLIETQAEIARLESEQAVARERARQVETRRQELMEDLKPLQERRKRQHQRVREAQAEAERAQSKLDENRTRLQSLEREWTAKRAQTETPSPRRRWVEQELETQRAQRSRLDQRLLELRAEAAQVEGERKALERLHRSGEAYNAGVQALLQADVEGVRGPLAAHVHVPSQWEKAVAAAMGEDLQAVVVDQGATSGKIARVLEAAGGRLTLLPLDDLRALPAMPAAATRASDVVASDAGVEGAIAATLGRIALCRDAAEARTLLPDLPADGRCVTPDGTVLTAGGALTLGEARAGDLLAEERARRELPAALDALEERRERVNAQRGEIDARIDRLEEELRAIEREEEAAREEAARAQRETLGKADTQVAVAEETVNNRHETLRRERAMLEQLDQQIRALQRQREKLEAEHEALAGRLETWAAEQSRPAVPAGGEDAPGAPTPDRGATSPPLRRARRRYQTLEEQQRTVTERIDHLEQALERAGERVTEAREEANRFERETWGPVRTRLAVAEEALRSQQSALQRERAVLDRLETQIDARHQRADELSEEHRHMTRRRVELRQAVEGLETQLREVRQRVDPAEDRLADLAERLRALEQREREAQDTLRNVEARSGQAQLEAARRQDELDMLAQRIEEELGLVELELADSVTAQTLLPLQPLVSQLPIVEKLPEGLQAEIQRLKARLRKLGNVNPNAPDEYAETEERHQFLTEQSADLEKASAQLREAVTELDQMIEAAFRKTFEAVSVEFSAMFPRLFNGGSAQLKLTDPDDMMNTGVDIVARPPGKRTQQLALLSGGERALTAAALLFSLLRVSPTPFCVLDEVDAMLDEANVGRFRNILEELAENTQFIVITHNRFTVESADTVYGISMGSDSVSQVVSLKMEA